MRPFQFVWTAILLGSMCSATPAQDFPVQKEGKFLNPPNLSQRSDDLLTGMTVGSLPGYPISATIEVENVRYDSSGKTVTVRFRSKMYRDSKGRTRLEWDMTPLGETPKAGWFSIEIYDPTTRTSMHLQPSEKTAFKGHLPAPDEKPQQVCRPSDLPRIDPKELARIAIPQVSQTEISHDVVDGMAVRHGRESIIFPHTPSAKNASYVTDYWFSQELQAYVLVKRSGPGKSQHVIKLTDVTRAEPDASLFAIPSDYAVSKPQPWDGDCSPKLML
jgi:hypothetical protein